MRNIRQELINAVFALQQGLHRANADGKLKDQAQHINELAREIIDLREISSAAELEALRAENPELRQLLEIQRQRWRRDLFLAYFCYNTAALEIITKLALWPQLPGSEWGKLWAFLPAMLLIAVISFKAHALFIYPELAKAIGWRIQERLLRWQTRLMIRLAQK